MAAVITKDRSLSRRLFLRGARAIIGVPPLAAMFNLNGTAYAAPARDDKSAIQNRFVLWFNGNGIPERYWIPAEEGTDYHMTPCLSPLAAYRRDFHILSGVDNAASSGQGNGHTNSMSGLMTGTNFTGRGPSGASIDQVVA